MTDDQRRRCLRLAQELDGVTFEAFSIGFYRRTHDCRTIACAAGYAGEIPEFVAEGFGCNGLGPWWDPRFPDERDADHRSILEAYFGVEVVFFPDYYDVCPFEVTPAMVAQALREAAAGSVSVTQ